jgi:hypothetical protein
MPSTILSDNGASSGTAGLKSTGSNDGQLVLQTTTAGGTATTAMTIDTGQAVTFAQTANLPNTFGFKNRIINGGMVIDQRNAGASVTLTSGGVYTVDRFIGFEDTDGAMTAQQDSSAPTGFVNSLKCTTTTADGTLAAGQYVTIIQKIEGTNVSDLAWGTANAKTITLSFWVRSSLTGTFGGSLRNSAGDRSYPFTYSISAANTWEQKSVTIAGDTTGTWLTTTGVGIQVAFGLGVGSTFSGTAGAWAGANYVSATGATSVIGTLNATWYITGAQLEVGSTATSFDYRDYGRELIMCQRYFETSFNAGTAVANNSSAINAGGLTAFAVDYAQTPLISFNVNKRTAPTITPYSSSRSGNVAGQWMYRITASDTWAAAAGTAAYGARTQNFVMGLNFSGTPLTSGTSYLVEGNWTASAEL